jgi:osmotically-inducible protein OsmY
VAHTVVALAALCGVVACATSRTDAQREADKATAARVQAALEADRALYAKHIFVSVTNGVVRLSGYVWDPPDLNEARSTAELVPGVTRVVNDLELQQNGIDNSPAAR